MHEEDRKKISSQDMSQNTSSDTDTFLEGEADVGTAKDDTSVVSANSDAVDDALQKELPIDEYKKILDTHFQNLRTLIRYTKTKDETIYKLSGELQKHREDYCAKTFKTIAILLISYREDCRKSRRDMETFGLTLEQAKKYMSFLCDEYEELLSNIGCEKDEDMWLFGGRLLDGQGDTTEKGITVKFSTLFEADIKEESSETEIVGSDIKEYLRHTEEAIQSILAKNEARDKCLEEYVNLASVIEEDIVFFGVYPLVRKLISLFDKTKQKVEKCLEEVGEENRCDKYRECLDFVIERTEDILLCGDVRIETAEDEMFQPKKNRVLSVVATEDASLDRKIAKQYTECYVMKDVVIYPAKVDVYKYQVTQK